MKAELSFFGGAGEVTGSRHLLSLGGSRVLLDCGLFQGHRLEALAKNRELPFEAARLSSVIVSHAHVDHSGGLPILVQRGLSCAIHATGPTAELCRVMLLDSAHLNVEDARFFNKIHAAEGRSIAPLYDEADAEKALALFRAHDYGRPFPAAPGVTATLLNAGHVLGSAMIQLDWGAGPARRRLLFTGDLGRRSSLLMPPPRAPRNVDFLVIETTYGDRIHEPLEFAESRLADAVRRVVEKKSKLLIPSFALERAQEVVVTLERLRRAGTIPALPVYVDSPMAADISEIFRRHPAHLPGVEAADDPFGFKTVRYLRGSDESRALNALPGPMIIISASGMCEGGRILHHLRNNLGSRGTVVLLVGYQAAGTLGRRLADGAKTVKIFGLPQRVRASVEVLHSLSAHADREDLLAFIEALRPRPRALVLVHGDPLQRASLAERLRDDGWTRVLSPNFGETVTLD